VFCALKARDFASGVRLAVNHSGDSDSTGSIAGNLLGTALGVEAIPQIWLDRLEARQIIETIADDMQRVLTFSSSPMGWEPTGNVVPEEFFRRYPPN
jgi:ADP-ribosylglycohydrolase